MTSNAIGSTKILVNAVTITLFSCISVTASNAQTIKPMAEFSPSQLTSPSSETQPSETLSEEPPSQRSYIGLGGVIGLQGKTTSLSQGTFSVISKQVLSRNFAIHSDNTIFGSLRASSSVALTYNHPIRSESLPIVFIPFLGGGVIVHDENGLKVNPLVTAGIDIDTPINMTGTVRINSGFIGGRSADVGVIFGVGYNY